jgi:DNA-directed RNA polymerase specialized sigma24 family protein
MNKIRSRIVDLTSHSDRAHRINRALCVLCNENFSHNRGHPRSSQEKSVILYLPIAKRQIAWRTTITSNVDIMAPGAVAYLRPHDSSHNPPHMHKSTPQRCKDNAAPEEDAWPSIFVQFLLDHEIREHRKHENHSPVDAAMDDARQATLEKLLSGTEIDNLRGYFMSAYRRRLHHHQNLANREQCLDPRELALTAPSDPAPPPTSSPRVEALRIVLGGLTATQRSVLDEVAKHDGNRSAAARGTGLSRDQVRRVLDAIKAQVSAELSK